MYTFVVLSMIKRGSRNVQSVVDRNLFDLYFVFVHALSMPHIINMIQSNAAKVEVKYKKYIYIYIFIFYVDR